MNSRLNQQSSENENLKIEIEKAKEALDTENVANQALESCIESLKKEKSKVESAVETGEANMVKLEATNQQIEKERMSLEENVKRLTGKMIYFRLRFGLVNTINTYLMVKAYVVFGDINN